MAWMKAAGRHSSVPSPAWRSRKCGSRAGSPVGMGGEAWRLVALMRVVLIVKRRNKRRKHINIAHKNLP